VKVPDLYKANYPGQSEERVLQFYKEDVAGLERIMNAAQYAPVFRHNPWLCVGPLEKSIYQIPYSSVRKGKLCICAHDDTFSTYWDTKTPVVVKEYSSAAEVFADGWLLS
jgi:hypothetical protein